MSNNDLMKKYKPAPKLTSIVDFFDPTNLSHLEAYKTFEETGYFPDHFIPADVKLSTMWRYALASKLATLFVSQKINELTGKTLRHYKRD